MKKKTKFLSTLLLSLLLVSCSQGEVISNNQNHVSIDKSSIQEENNSNSSLDNVVTNPTFRVCLMYDNSLFIPQEKINVIWANANSTAIAEIGSDGYAKTNELDGFYNVHLQNLPEGYTYNPNIYTADSNNPYCEIEIIKLSTPKAGTGADLYSKIYHLNDLGTYRAIFKKSTISTLYYEYHPKQQGVYQIESMVDVNDDIINPVVQIYNGTSSAKFLGATKDDGGYSVPGGYTVNFKWSEEFDESNLSAGGGAIMCFGVKCETKTGIYPLSIDFTIRRIDDYAYEDIKSEDIVATEANFVTPEFSHDEYILTNTDGKTGNYDGTIPGKDLIVLSGKEYAYNEVDGFYYRCDPDTKELKERLVAYITKPCPYYPNDEKSALNVIESNGNKNLTVSNGTENYKDFIEKQYAAICNSDGVCFVTKELKEFLQKFAVSQRLFMDGNGYVEHYKRYAAEADQWLFACAYYVKK